MLYKSKRPAPKAEGLNIIIVGCGKVGATLVEQLSREGHDITIIDHNQKKIQEITNQFDIMGLTGNGASYSVQMEADIEKADLFIAVTGSDELNLLCCTIAQRVGQCSAIARVRTPDYSHEIGYLREKLGLAMIINPELEAASEVARILCLPTALDISSFAHGQAELIKYKIPPDSALNHTTIAQFAQKAAAEILICAVQREDAVYIPSGSFELLQGDTITFVATRKTARLFFRQMGLQTNRVHNTMIIGGGKASYYLAEQLLHLGISVKIIESDSARCEELSVLLPKAIIINGDGTDQELLEEEGLSSAESFVPLTGIDEENVLLTLYARQVSDAKVVTKINRNSFKNVISGLDLGSVIYPRYITSEAIIAYVRAKKASMNSNVETLYHLFDNKAEAIEFHVNESSDVTDVPLMYLALKDNLLIASISRNGKIIIPSGRDDIRVGDNVMIVTTHTGFNDIQDILQ